MKSTLAAGLVVVDGGRKEDLGSGFNTMMTETECKP